MSSYIVDKKEFIKAAGLMCGYEGAKRDKHQYFVDVCRKEFEHCYALNVISVNEQYGDNCVPEEENYDDVFEAYRRMGELIQREGYGTGLIATKVADVMDKRTFRKSMWHFFNSVLYQIDDKACHRAVAEWFYTCNNKLYADEISSGEFWYGEIKLDVKLKAA